MGNLNNTRRKPEADKGGRELNDQLYDRSKFTGHIVGVASASSNSFTPCNWFGETTYRTPRNRENLTSRRHLEGELVHQQYIFTLRRSRRLRHRSSSSTARSLPSPSIPYTSCLDLVVIPVLVVDLYKYYSSMIDSIVFAMMLIASMFE